MDIKSENIKSIYQELIFILSQTPNSISGRDVIKSDNILPQYHSLVDKLIQLDSSYDRFKLDGFRNVNTDEDYINTMKVRTTMSALIGNLHANFFPAEVVPFGGMVVTNGLIVEITSTLVVFVGTGLSTVFLFGNKSVGRRFYEIND